MAQTDPVQQCFDKAREDEMVVAALRGAGGPWSMAAYHIQQAAEKYIKASLLSQSTSPLRSHDLQQLLGLLRGVQVPAEVQRAAAMIGAYAWITRYPGSSTFELRHIEDAERDLETIKNWLKQEVNLAL